jgi:CBS domain-containing protein
MKLREIMIGEVIQTSPGESTSDAAKQMRDKSVGCLVVTVGGAVKGIITHRDLLNCLAQAHDPYRCTVSAHMHRPVFVLRPEEDHVIAAKVLYRRKIKRLPVAENGRLLGIISLSDLAALAEKVAGKLEGPLNFFADVVRAQSAQSNAFPPPAVKAKGALSIEAEADASDLLDAGDPR